MALGKAIVNVSGVCIRPIGKHPLKRKSTVMLVVDLGQGGKEYKALGYTAKQVAECALRGNNPKMYNFSEEQKTILNQIANS